MSFRFCKLRKERLNGWYRDAFLYAILAMSSTTKPVDVAEQWFRGYPHEPRWMELTGGRGALRNEELGLRVRPPSDPAYTSAFKEVASEFELDEEWLLTIPQEVGADQVRRDKEDRVVRGAALLDALVAMSRE